MAPNSPRSVLQSMSSIPEGYHYLVLERSNYNIIAFSIQKMRILLSFKQRMADCISFSIPSVHEAMEALVAFSSSFQVSQETHYTR